MLSQRASSIDLGLGSECQWTAECQVSVTESFCRDGVCACNLGFSASGELCEYINLPAWAVFILIAVGVTAACFAGLYASRYVRRKLGHIKSDDPEGGSAGSPAAEAQADESQVVDDRSLGELDVGKLPVQEDEEWTPSAEEVEGNSGATNRRKSTVNFYDNVAIINDA